MIFERSVPSDFYDLVGFKQFADALKISERQVHRIQERLPIKWFLGRAYANGAPRAKPVVPPCSSA